MDKFARVCVNIMRHYNEGWVNGFHHNIEYWENCRQARALLDEQGFKDAPSCPPKLVPA